jgi:alkylhydroperoxidase family enzyme
VRRRARSSSREGTSSDPATAAIVVFAQQVLAAPAEIGDADVDRLRTHGYRDEQIAEVAGLVALQLLTGAFKSDRGHPRDAGGAG